MRRARAASRRSTPSAAQFAELCGDAALPVDREVGRLLYTLVRTARPSTVVEFGTSFGASTIYLGAAVRDNQAGRVLGVELNAGKVTAARRNLADAGLAEFAQIVEGDAREVLADVTGPVDFVLLDGWKELYLPVLRLLEPKMPSGALVVADNLPMLPPEYTDWVRDPSNGYTSVTKDCGGGIELSVRSAG
ncbi:methyltransferase [Amycolatopsis alba DSM 44262]|uniref:Methyltransferase n=2 Tax=Amycolatopsis alba TaxID=76020 RepID=A0A229S3F3_AMYAL|nr:methyltransferase [Amycolatopsis alba DSM 44262]